MIKRLVRIFYISEIGNNRPVEDKKLSQTKGIGEKQESIHTKLNHEINNIKLENKLNTITTLVGLRDFYIESGEAQHPNNNISPDQLFVLDRKVREKANKLLTNKLSSITTLVGLQTFLVEKQVARNDRIISANQSDILDKKVDEKIKILRKNPL